MQVNDGKPHRPDEKARPKAASPPRPHCELLSGQKLLGNGIVVGMNNKHQLVTEKSYGFRDGETRKIALYHTFGDLPTPPQTDRFVR